MHLSIPAVENFRLHCQMNPENEYKYAFVVEFADPAALEAFQAHPLHQNYVQEQWNKNVDRYLISDLKAC